MAKKRSTKHRELSNDGKDEEIEAVGVKETTEDASRHERQEQEDEAEEEAREEHDEEEDALEVMLPMKAAMQLAVDTTLTLLDIDGIFER
jgi:hypothetical protein